MQGESAQFVDPAGIPADADVAGLGQALAAGRRGDLYELMVNTAAYSGLRQGELFALTTGQITPPQPRHRRGPQGHRGQQARCSPGCPRAASAARPSTPSAPRRGTRWRRRSRPGSRPHAPRCKPAPTRSG